MPSREIQVFTRGLDLETFREDEKSMRAVEMNFIIIGESAGQIPVEVEEKYPEIPWNQMRAMLPETPLRVYNLGYDWCSG